MSILSLALTLFLLVATVFLLVKLLKSIFKSLIILAVLCGALYLCYYFGLFSYISLPAFDFSFVEPVKEFFVSFMGE